MMMVGFGVLKWSGMEWTKGDLNMKIRDDDDDDDGIVYDVCLLVIMIMITYSIYLDVRMFIPS